MATILNRVLLFMSAAIVLVDGTWLVAGHFRYDAANYGLLALLMLPLAAGSAFYNIVRKDESLSAILACSAFLIVFPAGCALLSYLLVTVTGPRIDTILAAADRALGFSWPALMGFISNYPTANLLLKLAYVSVMPQTVVLIFALGFGGKIAELYRFSLALTLGALVTLAVWTIAPSFGAFSVYTLPDAVAGKLGLVLGFDYGHVLVKMLRDGPGFISPKELRGIVGFPSYHTLQALVLMWYARSLPMLRWPAIALNVAVLAAIPIHGGHHLVDAFGGTAVTLLSIWLAARIVAAAQKRAAAQQMEAAKAIPGTPNQALAH
ncbi:MAG TPA: phosphatase PAP2 family protein [Rhizomicrobium sp.]|nr:phosphatase PAP2 family protein [Rhizomicrobium sp.]